MATAVQAVRDWEYEGTLRITGAETLRLYHELREKQGKIPCTEYGVFFAFSKEQFDRGYKGLVSRGLIKDGDRVTAFGSGCYGTREGMKRWTDEAKAIDERIRTECDPLEVYFEEWNNYECCIDFDGDLRAVQRVLELFGLQATSEALKGRRFRPCGEIEAIWDDMQKN